MRIIGGWKAAHTRNGFLSMAKLVGPSGDSLNGNIDDQDSARAGRPIEFLA